MCMTHGEHRLISSRCQKEDLESIFNGQTDSHSDYSAYLRVVQNFDSKSLKYCFIDNFVLGIFIALFYIKKERGYCNYLRPSVCPSVMLSPPKPLDKIRPNLVCELLI